MNYYKSIIISATLIASLGCTTTAKKEASEEEIAKAEKEAGLICKMERQTGTRFKKKICRTPEQMAMLKEASQRKADMLRTNQDQLSPYSK